MPQVTHYVFNIGLNRAGTTSLTEALELLGYRALHYRLNEDHRLYDVAVGNLRAGRRPFAGIDQKFNAFSDFTGHLFFRQLDVGYPGSKFILTVRDLEPWLNSREWKVQQNLADPGYIGAFREVDRKAWAEDRERYLAEVTSYFADRPQDLLVMNIPAGDGWESLCTFLNRPIPTMPFHNVNAGLMQPDESESRRTI